MWRWHLVRRASKEVLSWLFCFFFYCPLLSPFCGAVIRYTYIVSKGFQSVNTFFYYFLKDFFACSQACKSLLFLCPFYWTI
nr:MAG TPA: hypothetical protein [Caudoviricetes sp.]